jgi:cellulose synthase/poly-beta-1,6-N-acetylglucosamine synthase-like glycosyltransferase
MILFFLILLVLMVTTIIVSFNFFTAPVLKFNSQENVDEDLVSVLIPARNESNNIENCLNKIINQYYNNIEIIVLDDESQDNTYSKVSEYTNKD